MFSPIWQYPVVPSATVLPEDLTYFFAANVTLKILGYSTLISASCLALYSPVVPELMGKYRCSSRLMLHTFFPHYLTLILYLRSLTAESTCQEEKKILWINKTEGKGGKKKILFRYLCLFCQNWGNVSPWDCLAVTPAWKQIGWLVANAREGSILKIHSFS